MYHRVGRPAGRSPVNGQYVSAASFARQMEVLSRLKLSVVPVEEVGAHVLGHKVLSRRDVAITFDDGFANLFDNAFPILNRYRFPSTVFLISDYIGKTNTYHPPQDDLYEPLLDQSQVLEMQRNGVRFGSHTRRHARLTECSPSELLHEVQGSKAELEALLQQPVTSFCYPYGAYDEPAREMVEKSGYEVACSTRKGRNDVGVDPLLIRRLNIRADTSLPIFLYKLARAWYVNR